MTGENPFAKLKVVLDLDLGKMCRMLPTIGGASFAIQTMEVMRDNIAKGINFENFCISMLNQLGFSNLKLTKQSNDYGADVEGVFGENKYVFQCKIHKKNQGNRAVQQAIAAKSLYRAHRCGVISDSDFTKSAYQLAYPNYCLLLTANELKDAVQNGKTFSEIINDYKFPNHIPVEHDYDVVKRYEEIKVLIGHTPRNSDIDPTTRYHIKKKYGNLTNLITQLGDKPFTKKPSSEDIKQEYERIKQIIGKTPTLADIEQNSDFSRNCFSSYPLTKLQKECGDAPNIERGVSKEDLVEAFHKLSHQLGRTPTLKDLDDMGIYRSSYYRCRWGNIDSFLEEIIVSKRNFKQRAYGDRELIAVYLLLKKVFEIRQDDCQFQINHTVLENLKYGNNTFISPGTFSKRFGDWGLFLETLDSCVVSELSAHLTEIINVFISADLNN